MGIAIGALDLPTHISLQTDRDGNIKGVGEFQYGPYYGQTNMIVTIRGSVATYSQFRVTNEGKKLMAKGETAEWYDGIGRVSKYSEGLSLLYRRYFMGHPVYQRSF